MVINSTTQTIHAPEAYNEMAFVNPIHHAIIVGINDYDDFDRSNIGSLNGCVNDALLFEQWLTDPDGGGLDPANVRKHHSRVPRPDPIRPSKVDIENEFIKLIQKHQQTGTRLGDRLYLWFSGHGITPSQDETECAILMANAQLSALKRSFPGRFAARDICFRTMFKEVVLFMDCCRTVSGLETVTVDYDRAGNPTGAQQVKYLQGFATSSSAASAERLLPHPTDPTQPDSVHGVFTHALLEGLKKGTNLHGRIDSQSLARYVKQRTEELMPPEDRQRPDFDFKEDQLMDFGLGQQTPVVLQLSQPAVGFQIRFGKDISQVVSSQSGLVNPITSIQLPPALYLFAVPGHGNSFTQSTLVEVLGEPVNVTL